MLTVQSNLVGPVCLQLQLHPEMGITHHACHVPQQAARMQAQGSGWLAQEAHEIALVSIGQWPLNC